MTFEDFDTIATRIKYNLSSVKSNWYDGHRYTDPQGNWYGWTDGGYCEYLFYAGEEWERRFVYRCGKPTYEITKIK